MFWSFNKETVTGLFRGRISKNFRVSVEVVVFWGAFPGLDRHPILVRLCSMGTFTKDCLGNNAFRVGRGGKYSWTTYNFVSKLISVGDFGVCSC